MKNIVYPTTQSVIRPVPHDPDLSMASSFASLDIALNSSENEDLFIIPEIDSEQQRIQQGELNHLVRDTNIPKDNVQLLVARLKEKNLYVPVIIFT